MAEVRTRLMLITTVPETLQTILKGQPRFLADEGGFSVSIVTSCEEGGAAIRQDEGVQVYCVPMKRRISPLSDILAIIRLVGILIRVKPHVVHTYTPKAGLIGIVSSWICRIPIRIHTFTGLLFPTAKGLRRHLLITVDKVISQLATTVVPEGKGVKRELEQSRITRKKLSVVGNGNIAGVDTSYFCRGYDRETEPAASLAIAEHTPEARVFIFIGRLNKDKGLNELAAAFQMLQGNVRLFVLGGEDKSAPVAHSTLQQLKDDARVSMLGFQSDIRPFLAVADVLVLPSYREGFPNVLLQASAMEVPIIATDVSGCNEIVTEGTNGWLVPPMDANKLARAMQNAINIDRESLRKAGRRGREVVVHKFEQGRYRKTLLEFYRRQLGRR